MADATVNLDLMAPGYWGPSVPAGWTEATGATGFVYKFSGGNSGDDDGSVSFTHGGGEKTIEIKLVTADGGSAYQITGVGIFYDDGSDPHDLAPPDSTDFPARSVTVLDSDAHTESGTFNVTCSFNDVTGIVCDPKWQNN